MSEAQGTQTTNEFGSPQNTTLPAADLNAQGKETTLDDILAALNANKKTAVPSPDAVAPAAEPAPAPKPDDTVVPVDSDINTGNKALDIAVRSFIKSAGASDADIQRACKNALEYGDNSLIDRAFLAERFGDKADDALAIVEAVIEQTGVERQRLVDSVYSTAGGKEGWDQALAVYKQHAQPALQKAIQMMFDSGDATSVKEAAELVVSYAKGSGALPQGGNRIVAGSGTQDSQGLSQADFQKALGQLNQSGRTYQQDYQRLFEMRRIGKQLGK